MVRSFRYSVFVACAALVLAVPFASADDKAKAPVGVWAKKGGDLRMDFGDKGVLKILPQGDKAEIVVVCKYTIDKDGLVKATITEFEEKAELTDEVKQVAPVGLEFSFKYTAKGDAATLDDLKGDKTDALRAHLEGDYEQKK